MYLLAIETSCDETCAAVVEGSQLKSNVVASQEVHQQYGGVVPELASRAHIKQITPVVGKALERAGIEAGQLDALAVTYGPGLIGSLLVGTGFAKGMALDLGIPLVGINHLDGHLFSNHIETGGPEAPFLSLIISGGHTILAYVKNWGEYFILGETQDDAAGEAFDKVAKILELPYPGGPQIEKLATTGNPQAIDFPIAKLKEAPFDFSFSGLKTAVLYHTRKLVGSESESSTKNNDRSSLKADIAASFQHALIAALVETTARAYERFPVSAVALAGGVACNQTLRNALTDLGRDLGFTVHYPKPIYCTDNAAMIARAASFYLTENTANITQNIDQGLSISPNPGLKLHSTASIVTS